MSQGDLLPSPDPNLRIACVQVPALPLQILLREHPDWQERPCAVVSEDRPQGTVLWVNRRAREARVLPGLRFIAALGLAPDLRAGALSEARIEEQVGALLERLGRSSPDVEPYGDVPGVFWLNAQGLVPLFPSLEAWAQTLRDGLKEAGFYARVVVGFSRFGSYAAACAGRGSKVFADRGEERTAIRQVPLSRLDIPPRARDALGKLGVEDVAGLLRLPSGGLRARFGAELWRLHCLASGESGPPLSPQRSRPPVQDQLLLDFPERDAHRLLFCVKRLLPSLLAALAVRGEAVRALRLRLTLDRGPVRGGDGRLDPPTIHEELRPAAPSLDERQLLDLVRLCLERILSPGGAGVVEVRVSVEGTPATEEQLRLFSDAPRRDLAAANRALARLRAELGDDAVVCADLREAHLPEARFALRPFERLVAPRPHSVPERPLVRRLYDRPRPLPPRLRLVPEGWMLGKHEHGAVERLLGPFVVSGGWWAREVERHYHFAETSRGHILWIYNDKRRRRWFVQGEVQ